MMLSKTEIERLKDAPWFTFEVTYQFDNKTHIKKVRGKQSFTWELENCVRFTIVGAEGESLFELDGDCFVCSRVVSQTNKKPSLKIVVE